MAAKAVIIRRIHRSTSSDSSVNFAGIRRYDDVYKKSKGNIAWFAIVFARVLDGDQRSIEDHLRVMKIDAVFGEIESSLLFIPGEHGQSVATLCRYVKTGPAPRSCRLTFEFSGLPKASPLE